MATRRYAASSRLVAGLALLCSWVSSSTAVRDQVHQATGGGLVIAGGYFVDDAGKHFLSSVEVDATYPLPDLPHAVRGHSLTAIGSVLYSCGGFYDEESLVSNKCYSVDTSEDSPKWKHTVTLPHPIEYHTAVSINDTRIWFIQNNTLYDLDTTDGRTKIYYTQFTVETDHCAVSDGVHSYIFGVGPNKDEIWATRDAYSPDWWVKVGSMPAPDHHFGCLIVTDHVMLTGGVHLNNKTCLFSFSDFRCHETTDLTVGRNSHKMFLFEGKPAVVGGHDDDSGDYLNDIEVYDMDLAVWHTDPRELRQARSFFGLAQLPG